MRQLHELLIGALRQGPVPRHVAFEMDGNRRYARQHRMETVEGHHHGFEALARVRSFLGLGPARPSQVARRCVTDNTREPDSRDLLQVWCKDGHSLRLQHREL